MINDKLRDFIASAIDNKYISADDVRDLKLAVLPEGVATRREAEALLALDRIVEADDAWKTALTEFIVACTRRGRAGAASGDDSLWLATALDMNGPTETAMTIAYAVLEETPQVDAALLDFIMRGRQQERMQRAA